MTGHPEAVTSRPVNGHPVTVPVMLPLSGHGPSEPWPPGVPAVAAPPGDAALPATGEATADATGRRQRTGPRRWPLLLIGSSAFVAIWSGWVSLGGMCGFGTVTPLPGIIDGFRLDMAITLPLSMESYGWYAIGAWLSPLTSPRARKFAGWSSLAALALGASGQVAYHLLVAAHRTAAPWPVTVVVSCIPVAAIGMGATLAHLLRDDGGDTVPAVAGGTPGDNAGDTEDDSGSDTEGKSGPGPAPVGNGKDDTLEGGKPKPRPAPRDGKADPVAAAIRRVKGWADPATDVDTAAIAKRLKVDQRTVQRRLKALRGA